MKKSYALGIDLGTSSVKVNLVDNLGILIEESSRSYELLGVEQGRFEQRPEDWIVAVVGAVQEVLCNIDCDEIIGIGLSAQMPSLVLMSSEGKPLCNSILWCDSRAEGQGANLLQKTGKKLHYEKTGVILDGRYLIPMYLWVKENQPELFQEKFYILSAKDYLYYRLCGKIATDPSTASGFGIYNLKLETWDEDLLNIAGIYKNTLPPILPSYDKSGKLDGEIAKKLGLNKGIFVACGVADSVAGVVGVGGDKEGYVCGMCGSSTALIATCKDFDSSSDHGYFVTPMAQHKTFGLEADILSTGSTQQWLLSLINSVVVESGGKALTFRELWEMAEKIPVGAEGIFFTPYLMGGEQGVLWNPTLSGSIVGLNAGHSMAHIVRAAMEGIGFEMKRCIEAFREGGARADMVVMSGPVTGVPVYMQMMADIMGIPCKAAEVKNASAYGAALIALEVTAKINDKEEFKPIEANHYQYNIIYETYKKISAKSDTR